MCIFCGGTCGGVGDAILSSTTLGISLVVLQIQVVRASHKRKLTEKAGEKNKAKPDSSVS
jgi:hypothetical protein